MHLISIRPQSELRKDEKDNKTHIVSAIFIKTEEGMRTIAIKVRDIVIEIVEALMTKNPEDAEE